MIAATSCAAGAGAGTVEGVGYLLFVGPGLLVSSIVMEATGEFTFVDNDQKGGSRTTWYARKLDPADKSGQPSGRPGSATMATAW